MWVVTNKGFISVVQDRNDSSMVFIRARRYGDLMHLMEHVDDVPYEIVSTPNNDYSFRVHISKNLLSRIMSALVNDIDYTNFKESIPKTDPMLKEFANRVWLTGLHTLSAAYAEFKSFRNSLLNTK